MEVMMLVKDLMWVMGNLSGELPVAMVVNPGEVRACRVRMCRKLLLVSYYDLPVPNLVDPMDGEIITHPHEWALVLYPAAWPEPGDFMRL
jgi:hypothetical protein